MRFAIGNFQDFRHSLLAHKSKFTSPNADSFVGKWISLMHRFLAVALLVVWAPQGADASICDYRPSALVGAGTTGVLGTGAAAAATAGAGMKAAGFYTLVHAGSGLTMLGGTAGGASAAGTVGIMGGTAGTVGAISAVLMSPVVLIGGTVVAAGTALFEGGCYLTDERVTDYEEVYEIVSSIALNSDPQSIQLVDADGPNPHFAVRKFDGSWTAYQIKDLYIVNGELIHRDMLLNTRIGFVGFVGMVTGKSPSNLSAPQQ